MRPGPRAAGERASERRRSGEPIALTPSSCEAEAPTLGPDHASVIVATNCGDLERRHLMRVAASGGPVRALTSGRGIVHGDDDHTVPFSQTVDLVQRLRDYGKAHVETLVFPDEQHGSVVHAHRVTTTQRIGEFFDRSMPAR